LTYVIKKKVKFFRFLARYRISSLDMGESKPIPVRLGDDLIARLDVAAKAIGTTKAGVIRFCVETWLRHFEAHGKTASLPVDWEEVIKAHDGRRKGSRARRVLNEKNQSSTGEKGEK
jgi:predicted DNA-binding protein